ncbi:MAG TPA: amino acid adenylation domain-containing protein, partial [Thermoanaerobaculia bacterium]|nr:amino acid adenylation domain-containing protein [Thermoanaerobaculia bacterium]
MNRENIEDIYRLSPIQHGMLFHSLYAPESGVYFEQFVFGMGADFDPAVFEKTWQTLVDHHPILRTCFVWADLKDPVQVVHRKAKLPFDRQDWRNLPAGEQEQRLQEYMAEDRRRGFDLTAAPLMRFAVLRLTDDSWKIVWSYHHLLLDGWSIGLLLREFPALYRATATGIPTQVAKRRPFRDYVAWLRRQDMTEAEAYWRRTLAGFTTPTPLVVDRPASRAEADPGRESRSLRIPEAETAEIKAWCQRQRLTMSTLAHGAWVLLLGRYSQERDVLFGSTVSGRPPVLPGAEAMLGCFINTLPVRVRILPGERVLPFLQELQTSLVELRRYEHSPLVDVQGWSEVPRQTPLFQSIVVVEGFLDSTSESSGYQRTNYPLTLVVGPDRELLLRIDYEAAHFDAVTIDRLLGHLRTLVTALPQDPERRLEDLPVLTQPEREQLLAVWNRPDVRFDVPLPLHRLFEARAAGAPEAPAVTFEGESRTYGELNARANRLAHHLRRLGVGPESRVGLCVDRSFEQVEGILAILKAGGAYVPLDPRYPSSRLSLIVEDSGLDVLVTVEALRELVSGPVRSVVRLDTDAAEIAAGSAENPESGAGPESLAYVIYTSGSTGRPKGSLLTHANVTRLMAATEDWFHFGPQDVWTLFHSFAFDFSVWEIWGALLYGGRLVVVPYWVSRSPEAFRELLVREKVTVLNQTPSAFRQLVQADLEATAGELELKWVVFGGEALELASLAPWFDKHGDRRPLLVNMYGITETTVHVTYREITRTDLTEAGRSPIGVPIPDLRVHLVDASFNLVPVGVPGEMLVAGAGLARGYLGRPDLTTERFVPDPFGGAGERLYRSGDLARRLPGGEVEYLGRIDHQVKIRGFRIELGEIEAVLASHPGVREAVVLALEDAAGDRRLVAWVAPRTPGDLSLTGLRDLLKDRLPDYMVPGALVEVPAIPLTAHGKVDRRALPDPDELVMTTEQEADSPRTPTEELVAGLWSEILGRERIGRTDNFFDLGGHSLLVTRVLSRVREVFQVELQIRDLFELPTIVELSSAIEEARRISAGIAMPPLRAVSREGDLPLSFGQERFWFIDRLQPGSAAYNIPAMLRVRGRLDLGALYRAFDEVIRRHESLRTVFPVRDGRPGQVILAGLPPTPMVDLAILPVPLRDSEARRLAIAAAARPFDIARGPLARFSLLRLGEEEHLVLLTLHHIVADGWSMGILIREIGLLYQAFSKKQPSPLPEPPFQYADFAAWQREWLQGEILETQIAFWRDRLAGLRGVTELPTDHPRPPLQTYRGASHLLVFPLELVQDLGALGRQHGATPFMVLLAGLGALLIRHGVQEDLAVGSPIAGRSRTELEDLIGLFLNTLVLRNDFSGAPSFAELLGRVRGTTLAAYAHQDIPFEKLVDELAPERSLSRSPFFQVLLVLQNAPLAPLSLPGITLEPVGIEIDTVKFDLTVDAAENSRGMALSWRYNRDLFDRVTISRMASRFQRFLEVACPHPEQPFTDLPLLSAAELQQLAEWSTTERLYPEREHLLHSIIEEQVERGPQATAVSFGEEELTYRELNVRANRLAHQLRRLGVGAEVMVGVCAERSLEMVVALLAVLKAGGAYVPLDPSYPADRLAYMLEDSRIPVLLTQSWLAESLPSHGAQVVLLGSEAGVGSEAGWDANPAAVCGPDNLAYMIYTSGSTGRPKGAMNCHRGIVNRLLWMQEAFRLDACDRVLQKTPFSFDVSVW